MKQKTKISAIVFMLFSALFASAGQIFYKYAANATQDIVTFVMNPFIYLGILFYGAGLVLMLKAMRRGELTVIYPILATSFIWVSLLSPLLFETDFMNLQKWIGVAVIVLGVTFVGRGRTK